LTRIILPQPLFFFIGGVLGSRLLVRKIFLYQAVTPLIYNLGIIFGAVFLSGRFGIYSLGIRTQALHQVNLPGRGQIEETTLLHNHPHHGRMRHGLEGVMQVDPGQRLAQFPELHADALGVDDQQG